MPVSPLTPLSLIASVNLEYLRKAFFDLEENHGFHIDTGSWCCRPCGFSDAWKEGAGKPYVFWHEQNEDNLHLNPDLPMALYFGVAKEGINDQEKIEAARTIIDVLEQHDLRCDWKDEDLQTAIMVHLNKHQPKLGDEKDNQDVALWVPKNDATEEYCINESEDYEPEDKFSFYHTINDGESLKDAVLRIDSKVRRHITHYQRNVFLDECINAVEPIFEIDEGHGHAGYGESLSEALNAEESDESDF